MSDIKWFIKGKWAHLLSLFFFLGIFIVAIMGSVKADSSISMVRIPIYSDVAAQCMWVKNFGVECPTCGLTRSFYAFFNGQFMLAVTYNYLVIPAVLLMVEIIIYDGIVLFFNKGSRLLSRIVLATVVVLAIMFLFKAYEMVIQIIG